MVTQQLARGCLWLRLKGATSTVSVKEGPRHIVEGAKLLWHVATGVDG